MVEPGSRCLEPEAVQGFLCGTLSAAEAEKVEEHIDRCPDCRALFAEMARRAPDSAPTELDRVAGSTTARELGAGLPGPATRVDRYVIERLIGAGGMGAVSLADDPELGRKICLKLLRPELLDPLDREGARARLLREAQAMAKISHPNVVPVFDIGTHDGQVFLAMEYVDGEDLARWLRGRIRTPGEILAVFAAAGRGLAAAHRAGLVHRDFKPQNVLIGRDGSVKVTDFGLARAEIVPAPPGDLAASPAGRDTLLDSPLTRTGALLGTPAYMAPEQMQGRPVDARSDQFAFCVALHEALFGERPFPGDDLVAILDATLAGRIRPMPLRAALPRRARAALLRGLRAEPRERFRTMEELLGELAPRPRRWIALAAAALLLAGGGAALALAPRDEQLCAGGAAEVAAAWGPAQRERIEAAFAATGQKAAASSFAALARDLDAYAAEWAAAQRDACAATRVREDQTEEMMGLRMACLERRRAELAAAVEILERPDADLVNNAFHLPANLSAIEDCADARALSAPLPLPRDRAVRDRIATLRAVLARAHALTAAQRMDDARSAVAPVVPAAVEIAWPPLAAEAHLLAAQIAAHQARHDDAEAGFHAAALAAEKGGHDRVRAEAYLGLTELGQGRGKLDEALRWAGYARAIAERTGSHPGLLGALSLAVGDVYADRGDNLRAAAEYDRAIALMTRDSGPRSANVASALWRRGAFYFRLRRYDRAMIELDRSLALWTQLGGPDHPSAILVVLIMSDVRREQGRPADAVPLAERALAAYRRLHGEASPHTAGAYNTLGLAQQSAGRTDEGLANQTRALDAYRRTLGPQHPYVATYLGNLAAALMNAGRLAEAEAHMTEAVAIAARQGDNTPDVILLRNGLGAILTRARKYDAAIAQLDRALAAAEAILDPAAPQLADTLTRLGTAHLRHHSAPRAAALLERALSIRLASHAGPWESSWTKLELARALRASHRDPTRARHLATQARTEAQTAGDPAQARAASAWLAHEPR